MKPDFGDLAESSDSSSMEDSEIAKNAAAIHAIEKEEEDLARFGHLKTQSHSFIRQECVAFLLTFAKLKALSIFATRSEGCDHSGNHASSF